MVARCIVCGDPHTSAKGRCGTCYQYLRRTGRDRSERLVIKLTERDIERELMRRQRRARGWDPNR